MIINDLNEVKTIISNNIELCRLHDFIRGNQADLAVVEVTTNARFNRYRMVWYTLINSMYSSISLIHQFIKNQGDDVNDLDTGFDFASWYIEECYEENNNGNRNQVVPDLAKILRRLRNSVSHGSFLLDTTVGNGIQAELIFRDKNLGLIDMNTEKYFFLKMKAHRLDDFLQKIESKFNQKYP